MKTTIVSTSDDPQRVRRAVMLFLDEIAPGASVRISYNHVNATTDPLTLALVVLNDEPQAARIGSIGGYAGPDLDAAAVGHTATAAFVRQLLSTPPREDVVAANTGVALIARGFGPEQCLCGIFEIENRSAGALRFAVVASPVGVAPVVAVGTLPIAQGERAPLDVAPAPGLAPALLADRFERIVGTATLPFALPAVAPAPGVLRTFEVAIANEAASDTSVDLIFSTAGYSSTTVAIDGTLYEVARTPPQSRVSVVTLAVPTGGRTVTLVATSDLNSPAPVTFGFAPSFGPHAVATDAAVINASRFAVRGVAAEVRARPVAAGVSRIAEPLAGAVLSEALSLTPHRYHVIVEIDPRSRMLPALARAGAEWLLLKTCVATYSRGSEDATHPYFFASMTAPQILAMLAADDELARRSRLRTVVSRIWQDHVVTAQIVDSVPAVKGDAAHTSFVALGTNIVWAVIDSGVEQHPHFQTHGNLLLPDGLSHRDYCGDVPIDVAINALKDEFGHGTHVAGIIAGEWGGPEPPLAATQIRVEGKHQVAYESTSLAGKVSGVAPKCKILSMRVLRSDGTGDTRSVISALEDVLAINDYGRNIRIHGVNLSVGYSFNPDWGSCGATPICMAVNRLVASGVVVVVAAGNSGDLLLSSSHGGLRQTGAGISINDPGNAEGAITVGSCYGKAPHTLGIAPSSSKGPTGDGRPKPDVVAPGERVKSCAASSKIGVVAGDARVDYIEDSGTSMAAPHVSGAAAAYLSVRREFVGRPDDMKSLIVNSATDLKRDRAFQGAGLIDLFRMLVDS